MRRRLSRCKAAGRATPNYISWHQRVWQNASRVSTGPAQRIPNFSYPEQPLTRGSKYITLERRNSRENLPRVYTGRWGARREEGTAGERYLRAWSSRWGCWCRWSRSAGRRSSPRRPPPRRSYRRRARAAAREPSSFSSLRPGFFLSSLPFPSLLLFRAGPS